MAELQNFCHFEKYSLRYAEKKIQMGLYLCKKKSQLKIKYRTTKWYFYSTRFIKRKFVTVAQLKIFYTLAKYTFRPQENKNI